MISLHDLAETQTCPICGHEAPLVGGVWICLEPAPHLGSK